MMQKSVAIAVIDRLSNNIYLSERKKEPYKNKLALAGGKVEPNENLQAAAVRELFEETGINVNTNELSFFTVNQEDCCSYCTIFSLITDQIPQNMEPEKHGDWKSYTLSEIEFLDSEVFLTGLKFIILGLLHLTEDDA